MLLGATVAGLAAGMAGVARAAPGAGGVPPRSSVATEAPRRIVSLAPSVTETLFALGVGERVVAVSDFCDYPPAVATLPRVGPFLSPSVEAVLGARPDLVIGAPSPGNQEAVATLRRLGVRVEIVDIEHLDDLAPVTLEIAALAGVRPAGERLVADMQREMAAVRARLAGAPPRRVLMVIGQEPLVAVGRTSFLGELLEEAGGVNVAPPGSPWPHLNVEYVVAADPEVIIDSSMGTEEATARAGFWDPYGSVAAVRAKRVYPFRSYRVLRPGPRLPAALADLAHLIHPERWP